jgi:hypothetical protein
MNAVLTPATNSKRSRELFLVVWWAFSLIVAGTVAYDRLPALLSASATPFDLGIATVFTVLFLYPLVATLELGSMKLAPSLAFLTVGVEEVKAKVDTINTQLTMLSFQQLNQTVTVQPAITLVAGATLPVVKSVENEEIQAMASRLNIVNLTDKAKEIDMPAVTVDNEVEVLGGVVDRIEAELRRIARPAPAEGQVTIERLVSSLAKRNVLSAGIAGAIRNIVGIARAAEKGDPIDNNHRQYVKEMAPKLMVVLETMPA